MRFRKENEITEIKETEFLKPLLSDEKVLSSAFRIRKSLFEYKSIPSSELKSGDFKDWELQRHGKRSSRLKRKKKHEKWLEDRTWSLFYRMGYKNLSGDNFGISFTRKNGSIGTKQIDVYADDDETALVIECKSCAVPGRRSLQKDIQETKSLQSQIRKSIYSRYKNCPNPKIIWIYATNNIRWSKPDIERALDCDVNIITENEIQYFEIFLKHMGPAGRFQILSEFLKGQKIPRLSNVKIPAIRGKIGGQYYYSFVTTPRNLLKIAFVNHHALNSAQAQPAYQRMVSATRIKEIGKFIENGGFFPTNILVNFSNKPRFDLISNKDNSDTNIKFGWITLPSNYRSAWIIDGQHRLYGFSHLSDDYLDQSLFVLAFAQLPIKKEADLFITINNKQKSVPRSLLVRLLADIRMGDDDPSIALTALASAIARELDDSEIGPLGGRFTVHGIPPDSSQNLTIAETVNGLRRSGLIGQISNKHKKMLIPGPLSGNTDKETISRASQVLNLYFEWVKLAHPVRWKAGKSAYISTNPGIRAHLLVIAEVVRYLEHKQSIDFGILKPDEFGNRIVDYCQPIFTYIENANDNEIKEKFSRQFGEGGVITYAYFLMQILSDEDPEFGSDEFRRWMEQRSSDRIDEVNVFILKMAERLTNYVIDTLKAIHGTHHLQSGAQAFWEIGVESKRVRENAFRKQQDDKERRKSIEAYLDVVDLIEIVKQKNNWDHFENVFNNAGVSDRKGKKYYLDWIQDFNELRKIAAHKNQIRTYTEEDLVFAAWLHDEVSPKLPN